MTAVHASILAVLTSAAWVTVAPTADDQCPSSAQVQAAIATHAPKLLGPEASGGPLTLSLANARASGELTLTLADRNGWVKLYRTLPPPPGDRARDCAALADTVAFIVERYVDEVELPALPETKKAPPAPEPPPPATEPLPPANPVATKARAPAFALSGTLGWRFPGGAANLSSLEYKLVLGAALARVGKGGALWMDITGGIIGILSQQPWPRDGRSPTGSATAVRSGGDLALLLAWPLWRGRFFVGPQVSADMVKLDSTYLGHEQHPIRFGAAAGLHLGYQIGWRNVFFRFDSAACAAVARPRFVAKSAENTTIFETPPAYITVAGGLGVSF